jgi:hypothetical protein
MGKLASIGQTQNTNLGCGQLSLRMCTLFTTSSSCAFPLSHTIWLTTAEMGFSVTEEQDAIVCTKDEKEGKVND